jgi:DNA-binding NarL/FixJ family response regulator
VRGPLQRFIEATTPYKVCDAVDNDASAIHKVAENHCDLMLLHLTTPLQDSLVTVSVLRSKLPQVKIVGVSTSTMDLENLVSPTIGCDAVLTRQQGLSKLVETLKALLPKPPGP